MDALEAIRTRRMVPRVGADRPTREEIEALLELAVRAPNHHRTEPWRFYVLTGDALDLVAQAMADEDAERGADRDEAYAAARKKVERAPVMIVVTSVASDDPKVIDQEDVASVAMAIQNMLLGAHVTGLGAMLRTGTVAYHPALARRLGLAAGEKVVGMLYIGHPAADRPLQERAPAADKTTWLGWN